jgi:predicted permease
MFGLGRELRHAVRQLARSPGFTATAVLMLALGICANSTAFSWIDGTMLHPVPGARDTGALVTIMRGTWSNAPSPPLSYLDYRDLRQQNRSFSGILGYHDDWATLTGGEKPERIYAAQTSTNYFDVLGVRPVLGRFFRPEEEAQAGGTPHLVLGYSLWRTRFGSDPEIVGKVVEINSHPLTVIGVAPEGFIGCKTGIRTDAWMPMAANTDRGSHDWVLLHRENAWLNVMGRLRPGVTREEATQDLQLVMQRIVAAWPREHAGANTITLDPLWRSPFGANVYLASALPMLLVIAAVVLLLTCANVATLALVRFVARRREIAIRQSLGAGRAELTRQMMMEGLLISLGAGLVALALTLWSARLLGRFIPPNASPIVLSGAVNAEVMGGIVVLVGAASLLCGALPAWRASQVLPAEALREESAALSPGTHHRRLLNALVVAQVALSLALLVVAGLLLRTLRNTRNADPGFDAAHVLTATVSLTNARYSEEEIRVQQQKLLRRMAMLPGVRAASIADWVPLNFTRKTAEAFPEGYVPQLHESGEVRRADVTAGYFATMAIPIVAGRAFTAADDVHAPRVAIVDQTAAARYWTGQHAVGQRLQIWGRWYTVVGVARNSSHQRVSEPPEPMVYLSFFQTGDTDTILQIATAGQPQALARRLERAVHEVNARLPVYDVRPLRETTELSTVFERVHSAFASAFAALALLLAASGIYGVVAYRTRLRTHEIGIRIALGAEKRDVLRLVVNQGLRLAGFGVALGLGLSFALTRVLAGHLYGVSANDPLTVVSVTVLLGAIAAGACWIPAMRAANLDPVQAMREL